MFLILLTLNRIIQSWSLALEDLEPCEPSTNNDLISFIGEVLFSFDENGVIDLVEDTLLLALPATCFVCWLLSLLSLFESLAVLLLSLLVPVISLAVDLRIRLAFSSFNSMLFSQDFFELAEIRLIATLLPLLFFFPFCDWTWSNKLAFLIIFYIYLWERYSK